VLHRTTPSLRRGCGNAGAVDGHAIKWLSTAPWESRMRLVEISTFPQADPFLLADDEVTPT
jgi:hypothetical protein